MAAAAQSVSTTHPLAVHMAFSRWDATRSGDPTFYEHFQDKEACFLASYDTGAAAIFDAMTEAPAGLQDWQEILDSVFSTWLEFLDADLAFTRA